MEDTIPDIIVGEEVFTKLSPAKIELIRQKMLDNPYAARPKAKGKWQEMVTLDDKTRYGVNCHREGDKITITGVREAKKTKRRVRQ